MNIGKIIGFKIDTNTIYNQEKNSLDQSTPNKDISDTTNVDTVYISDEARDLFNTTVDERLSVIEMLEELRTQKKDNSSDELLKCIKIALRIMNGDRVPRKDEKFLAEKQPQMYSNAVMLRREREYYKKYKSVLDDEEGNDKDSKVDDDSPVKSESQTTPEVTVDMEESGESLHD